MIVVDGGLGSERLARRRRVRAQVGGAIATLALLAIIGSWIELGTITPIVVVQTGSMVPTLHIGDVALMESLHGRVPKVGEIVVEPVPTDVQRNLHYPADVTHRVISITHGMVTTKGDANAVPEPFSVPISKIHTRLVTVIPGAGRLIRFLASPFGIIWLVFGGVLFLGPKVLELLRDSMVPLPAPTAAAGAVAGPGAAAAADSATLNELVLAVREYGQHLQSHTAIVQAMADASKQLSSVAARLEAGVLLAAPPPDPSPRRRPHPPEGDTLPPRPARARRRALAPEPPPPVLARRRVPVAALSPADARATAGARSAVETPIPPRRRPRVDDAASARPAPTRPIATAFAPSLRLTIVPEAVDAVAPPRLEVVTPTPKVVDRAKRVGRVVADRMAVAPPVLEKVEEASTTIDPAPAIDPVPAPGPAPAPATPATPATTTSHPPAASPPVSLELPTRASTGPLPWEQPRVAVRLPRVAGERRLVVPSQPRSPRPARVRTVVTRRAVPWADAPKVPGLPPASHAGPPPWAAVPPATSERHLA